MYTLSTSNDHLPPRCRANARAPRQAPTIYPTTFHSQEGRVTCPPPPTTLSCKRERAMSPAHHHSPPSRSNAREPRHPPTTTTTSLSRDGGVTHPPTPANHHYHPLVQTREGHVIHPAPPLPPPARERAASPAHSGPLSPGPCYTPTTTTTHHHYTLAHTAGGAVGLLAHHREGIVLI